MKRKRSRFTFAAIFLIGAENMTLPPVVLLAGLSLFAADDDLAPAVRDEANLFSPDARQKADEEIAVLRDVYHFDLVIETAASPPAELHKKITGMRPAQAALLLRTWAEAQANQAINKGAYVLICEEPGDVEVIVSPEALEQEFTGYDANRLRSLLKNMNRRPNRVAQRDKRLLEAVVQTREAIRYNLRPAFPWLPVGGVLVGVVGLWGVLSIVRRRLRAAEPAEPPRLNLVNAMRGGLFGTVAGHWIIDTLFVAASHSSAPLEEGQVRLPLTQPPPTAAEAPQSAAAQSDRLDLAAREEFV
jgi:hypothetical protein